MPQRTPPRRSAGTWARRLALPLAGLLLAAAGPGPRAGEPRALSQTIREVWTYRNGLPHNLAHRLLADRDGYLWIGTQEGLVRFDGVRFQVLTTLDTPGLAGNEISALAEDARGVLWVGTSGGLSRRAGRDFEAIPLGGAPPVTALAPDGQGGAWVGTVADGLWHVGAEAHPAAARVAPSAGERITALHRGPDGALWIGTQAGLARMADGKVEVLGAAGLPTALVRAIAVDGRGAVWVGTSGGAARRPPGAAAFEPVPELQGIVVHGFLVDRAGDVWVGAEPGVFRVHGGGPIEGLAGADDVRDVHALVEDAEGSLWVGTETGGLHRLRWGQVTTVGRAEGLSADVVWTVRQGRDGAMWFGTAAGLDRMAGGPPQAVHAAELRGQGVAPTLEDRAGRLWVGSTRNGLIRFDPGGAVRFGKADGLDQSMVRVLHEDAQGTIWVGTFGGLYRLRGKRFEALSAEQGLASHEVNTLADPGDGTLWIGTSAGLARARDGRLEPVVMEGGRPDRSDVTALLLDPDGTLWIGTVGEGLRRLQGDRVVQLTRREGLHEDTVLGIVDDGLGYLWLSGNHGLTRIARADVAELADGKRASIPATLLARAEGMRERECTGGVQPSAWRASDGRLWFPTIGGAVVVDPAHLQPTPRPPPPRIEELAAEGRPVRLGERLRLDAGTRRIDLRYTCLSLAAADRLRFRQWMEGLEGGYREPGDERVAHYTNLAPGHYVFHVAAANESGVWSTDTAVAFEILPYFWQAPWFYGLVAVAVAAAALGVHRLRMRGLLAREAELQARVEEEMGKVRVLSGLLPVCAWCKRIRDDSGQWRSLESYVSAHSEAQFTHGMCPECYARQERELAGGPPARPR